MLFQLSLSTKLQGAALGPCPTQRGVALLDFVSLYRLLLILLIG